MILTSFPGRRQKDVTRTSLGRLSPTSWFKSGDVLDLIDKSWFGPNQDVTGLTRACWEVTLRWGGPLFNYDYFYHSYKSLRLRTAALTSLSWACHNIHTKTADLQADNVARWELVSL